MTGLRIASLRRFTQDERGSPTVEFVLWLPVFILILALIVNASLLMQEKSKMATFARDAARQRAIGAYTSDASAEAYLNSLLPDPSLYRGFVTTDPSTLLVESKVQFKASGVILFGKSIVGKIFDQGFIISTEVYMTLET